MAETDGIVPEHSGGRHTTFPAGSHAGDIEIDPIISLRDEGGS